MKYIDAEKLKAEIQRRSMHAYKAITADEPKYRTHYKLGRYEGLRDLIDIIDSLQQDETQVDKMLSSQIWWEEQGWIMIPPDATIEGIDSLLRQVRKKLQQEQPEVDLENEFADFLEKENAYVDDNNKISYYNGSSFDHTSDIYPIARHFYELGLKARKV